jgi:hypothetical protein
VGTPPVWCRCRFDRLILNTAECIIYDLKISGSANPDWASRNIFDMGYDLKACHLATGLCAVNPVAIGRTKVIYIYVENVAPFCVTPIELTGEYKALGESKYARAMLRWQKGILENSWPEYASSIVRVEPPKYAVIKELGTI